MHWYAQIPSASNRAVILIKRMRCENRCEFVAPTLPIAPQLRSIFLRHSRDIKSCAERKATDGNVYSITDTAAWADIATAVPEFCNSPWNLALRLSADGVNPFDMKNTQHSMWMTGL
jgi:hypothetical protein